MENSYAEKDNQSIFANFKEIDQALDEDRRNQKGAAAPVTNQGEKTSLPALLRFAGAIVIITAAVVFMAKKWDGVPDIQRYFSFLAYTAVLSAAGFFCALRWDDDKSARTFLIVSAAIVPAHFCQLGGLLYSRFGELAGQYSSWITWHAQTDQAALLTTAAGVATLIPVTYIAFSALARAQAKILTICYILTNAVLLLPIRDPDSISLLALFLLGGTSIFDLSFSRKQPAMHTKEGNFIRLMLAVPVVLLIGRTLHSYDASLLLSSVLCFYCSFAFFVLLPLQMKNKDMIVYSQGFSIVPAAAGWALCGMEIIKAFEPTGALFIPILCLPIAAIWLMMSFYIEGSSTTLRRLAAILATGSVLVNLLTIQALTASTVCIIVTILTGAYGYAQKDKLVFYSGATAFILGILYHLRYAIDAYHYSPWLTLAITGVATVISASYLERHYGIILARMKEIKSWQ